MQIKEPHYIGPCTTLLQPCYNLVTSLLQFQIQACYKLVTTLLQPCTTRLQQACDKVVTSLTFPYGNCQPNLPLRFLPT